MKLYSVFDNDQWVADMTADDCVLLEDIYDHTRICPCYSKLSLMLRGIE